MKANKYFYLFLILFCGQICSLVYGQSNDYLKSINKDKLTEFGKNILPQPNKADLFKINGTLNWEYNYGFIPYVASDSGIAQVYRFNGNVNLQTASIPWNVSYNFSNAQFASGITNYINVAFDHHTFNNQLKSLRQKKIDSLNVNINNLETLKEKTNQRKYFYKELLNINNIDEINRLLEDSIEEPQFNDSIAKYNSLNISSHNINSQINLDNTKDELNTKKRNLSSKIFEAEKVIYDLQDKINYLKSLRERVNQLQSSKDKFTHFNKENLLGSVKKFKFGLTNPSLSPLFLNSLSVKGIDFEFEGPIYIALVHGITINNMFRPLNPIENSLSNQQNLFNFFDFGNQNFDKKITAIKFGKGQKNGSHIYLGLLSGTKSGNNSLIGDAQIQSSTITPINDASNYVIELDARLDITKYQFIQVFYDKSFSNQASETNLSYVDGYSKALKNDNANALLVNHKLRIKKLKTTIKSNFRLIETYFNNYGLGFIRSDNLRYSFKTDHQLHKSLKLSFRYKKEQDNLLQMFDYNNILTSAGAQIKLQPIKRLCLTIGYFPVIHELKTISTNSSMLNKNYIGNAVLSYILNNKKMNQVFVGSANTYLLTSDSTTGSYQTFQLSHDLSFNNGVRLTNATQYFIVNNQDGETQNTLLNSRFQFPVSKKSSLQLQGKYSYEINDKSGEWGYGLNFNLKLSQFIGINLSMEKLVQGDFYNSVTDQQTNNFPYYGQFQITNNF